MTEKTVILYMFLSLALISSPTKIAIGSESCVISLPINGNTQVLRTDNINKLTKFAESDPGEYQDLVLSPDDHRLVTTTSTNFQVFELTDMLNNSPFWDVCHDLKLAAFSLDASQIATVDRASSQIQLWDTTSGELISSIEGQRDEITSIAFSPSSSLFAWAGSNTDNLGGDPWIGEGSVFVYSPQSGDIVTSFEEVNDIVTELHFTSDNERIMFLSNPAGYNDFNMQLWDVEAGSLVSNREAWFIVPGYAGGSDTISLGVAESLGIANEFSYQIEIWDNEMDTNSQTIIVPVNSEMEPSVIPNHMTALALNGDASLVALGDANGQITIWDVDTGRQLSSFQAYSGAVHKLMFTYNDHLLIGLGSENDTRIIRIWGAGD